MTLRWSFYTPNFDRKHCRLFAALQRSRQRWNGRLCCIMLDYTIAWGVTCLHWISVRELGILLILITNLLTVRNWEFLLPMPLNPQANQDPDPRAMMRRRSSLVVADLPVSQKPTQIKFGGSKPPPSVFEEPESSSLLDSFGF